MTPHREFFERLEYRPSPFAISPGHLDGVRTFRETPNIGPTSSGYWVITVTPRHYAYSPRLVFSAGSIATIGAHFQSRDVGRLPRNKRKESFPRWLGRRIAIHRILESETVPADGRREWPSQPGQVQRFLRMRLKEWQHRDNLACSGRPRWRNPRFKIDPHPVE